MRNIKYISECSACKIQRRTAQLKKKKKRKISFPGESCVSTPHAMHRNFE